MTFRNRDSFTITSIVFTEVLTVEALAALCINLAENKTALPAINLNLVQNYRASYNIVGFVGVLQCCSVYSFDLTTTLRRCHYT